MYRLLLALLCCTALSLPAQDVPTPDAPAGYRRCASEDSTCVLPAPTRVIYGAKGVFTAPREMTGTVRCNNATFGDPLKAVPKACFAALESTGGTLPAPIVDSLPAPEPPVVPVPTPEPPVTILPTPVPMESVTTPCATGLGHGQWLDAPAVSGFDVERRDETRLVASDGRCLGLVSLRRTSEGDRYVVGWPPCTPGGEWRYHPTFYAQRASAITRVIKPPTCKAS